MLHIAVQLRVLMMKGITQGIICASNAAAVVQMFKPKSSRVATSTVVLHSIFCLDLGEVLLTSLSQV